MPAEGGRQEPRAAMASGKNPESAGGQRPDVYGHLGPRLTASSSKLWGPWMLFLGVRKREGLASISILTLWRPND